MPKYFWIDGVQIEDSAAVSEGFNRFFSTKNMTSDKNGYKNYLDETVRESFYLSLTDPAEIQDIINSLKPKKSNGYDGIQQLHFIKDSNISLLDPLHGVPLTLQCTVQFIL